jgi:peptide/nickel transport system ATP-binding protein
LSLLEIHDLKAYYSVARGHVKAVDNVGLSVCRGEALGLVGESGCGKSTLALATMRLGPSNMRIVNGSIEFDGTDILKIDNNAFRKTYRWKKMSMVFQGAMNALNPIFKVGDQIAEAITSHEDVEKSEALDRAARLIQLVGIDPDRINSYPHELSGGMKQRVMIAMALALHPDFCIADEPTTALDVIVQAQILKVLKDLQRELNLSLMLISHDLSVVAELCDSISIMYAGKIVECGKIASVFSNPQHPYTKGLISSFPSIKGSRRELTSIPGSPPNLLSPPSGCRFHPRCPYANESCKTEEPKMKGISENHYTACHHTD